MPDFFLIEVSSGVIFLGQREYYTTFVLDSSMSSTTSTVARSLPPEFPLYLHFTPYTLCRTVQP
jgi:hypothetical protein